jgi:hypothetical protein
MPGSVLFGIAFVVLLLLVLFGVASALWLVPLVVIGLGLLLLTPFLAKLRGTAIAQPDSGPAGVPTTREASYEPVQDPAERRP